MTAPLWSRRSGDHGGGGPVVVLVHGSMDRSTSFAKVAARLADLPVVVYDRRGYGRSVAAPAGGGLDEQVEDLVEVAGGPAVVAGHSLGGVIALLAAARHPELVRAALVFEPPLPWLPWWPPDTAGGAALAVARREGPEAAAESFMRRMVGATTWERLPAATRDQRRAEGRALVAELEAVHRPLALDLDTLALPVVAGFGERSAPHHRRAADEVAARVPGAALCTVAGAGHGAHASHPEEFEALVRQAAARARG